jgi:hypothetical protein
VKCEGTKGSSGVQHRRPRTSSCCILAGTDPTALPRRALDIALHRALRCSLAPLPPLGLCCSSLSAIYRHLLRSFPLLQRPHRSTPAHLRPCPQPTSSLALTFTFTRSPQHDCRKGQAAHPPAAQGTPLTLTLPDHVCSSSAPSAYCVVATPHRNHC